MAGVTAESLGRELADVLAEIKRPPANRMVRVFYVTVISTDPPYFVGRFEDGTELTMLHGKVRPIVGRTWRVREILGILLGCDWAAAKDVTP